jgi:hypothetical protein
MLIALDCRGLLHCNAVRLNSHTPTPVLQVRPFLPAHRLGLPCSFQPSSASPSCRRYPPSPTPPPLRQEGGGRLLLPQGGEVKALNGHTLMVIRRHLCSAGESLSSCSLPYTAVQLPGQQRQPSLPPTPSFPHPSPSPSGRRGAPPPTSRWGGPGREGRVLGGTSTMPPADMTKKLQTLNPNQPDASRSDIPRWRHA